LDSRILDHANLLRVEFFPLFSIKLQIEGDDVFRIHKVDERIAHIAFIIEINWQLEKIILALVVFVKSLEQEVLGIFIRNVLDHQSSAAIHIDSPDVDIEL